MPRTDWETTTIPKILSEMGFELPALESVLDIGSGLSFKGQYIDAQRHVAFDAYRPYLEKIQSKVFFTAVQGNAKEVTSYFLPHSFDMVIATDILEHMEKSDAIILLSDMDSLAKKVIYIEVPETNIPQNIDIWGHGGHTWQTHRSSGEWSKEELESYGFTVTRRNYTMSDAKRHTDIDDINREIIILDAVKFL
jgi:hypothetical protein